jgi:hypothetical protein
MPDIVTEKLASVARPVGFWPIPRIGRATVIPPDICREMIDATLEAIRRTLASGVQKYNVGSRGLERISLADLMKALEFWTKQLELAESGSGIICKRGIPTDH